MRTVVTPDLASRLRLDISRMARRLRQEAGVELSPSQTAALVTTGPHGPPTPSELAERERVQRPTVTRVLARLEEAGLVDRAADPGDRRSSLVSISPDGRALLAHPDWPRLIREGRCEEIAASSAKALDQLV